LLGKNQGPILEEADSKEDDDGSSSEGTKRSELEEALEAIENEQ